MEGLNFFWGGQHFWQSNNFWWVKIFVCSKIGREGGKIVGVSKFLGNKIH